MLSKYCSEVYQAVVVIGMDPEGVQVCGMDICMCGNDTCMNGLLLFLLPCACCQVLLLASMDVSALQ